MVVKEEADGWQVQVFTDEDAHSRRAGRPVQGGPAMARPQTRSRRTRPSLAALPLDRRRGALTGWLALLCPSPSPWLQPMPVPVPAPAPGPRTGPSLQQVGILSTTHRIIVRFPLHGFEGTGWHRVRRRCRRQKKEGARRGKAIASVDSWIRRDLPFRTGARKRPASPCTPRGRTGGPARRRALLARPTRAPAALSAVPSCPLLHATTHAASSPMRGWLAALGGAARRGANR